MRDARQTFLFADFEEKASPKPVNVASVPQRSPFRYPGGKTWFVPTFREWLKNKSLRPRLLVEPFAGGGIISLTALFENLVDTVLMVELDEEIAAVWQSIVAGEARWLAKRILEFDLTKEAVITEISKKRRSARERAFQTILKNRTFHGGILAEGSGFLKYGENGKGVLSRWYPRTLAKRFENLELVADRIEFRCSDGLDVLQEFASALDVVFFIDPPYTAGGKKAGKRLYRYFELDHEKLFSICEKLKGDFLITYDNADEVKALAREHKLQMRLMPMTNTHHAKMEELVIGKDLSWMDAFPAVHEPPASYVRSKKRRRCKVNH
ncbi:MAG: DNA adenine methylase [Candidatus Abyssobacteria bacterium SURF_5]|uniref:DNA adenine methylase n=1 Tax=Abyssobacteria bacterium (strain SURF_5) TaxID=2093360 RepID=A0A3A4NFZ7_ABYX5|nr:MAG: DNA adenine methylase [Candidatus Abyssubacteria bacterium SURF_5]